VIRGLRALAGGRNDQAQYGDVTRRARRSLAANCCGTRSCCTPNCRGTAGLGDRVQLQQVLLNLIMNGVEAIKM
jgi:C4-dicarboxylate-specific signal transduction histidine kinase